MSKKAHEDLKNPIKTEPLGQDRDKMRIWSFDGESIRLVAADVRLSSTVP